MSKPILAIVGRANVGKSTLFNRIVRKRSAVIEDVPGITRDRLYGDGVWDDKQFLVVDTGGFLYEPDEEIYQEVKNQVLIAVEESDVVLMLMDSDSGPLPLDIELITELRKYSKKVFYAVNKVDGPKKKGTMYDFYSLGVDLMPVSALNANGYEELMDSIVSQFPEGGEEKPKYPRVSIVGKPNVGKSTIVNALLGKDRMIVSNIPGTTRDAVDSVCSYYKKKYTLVDTAGIRRKGKMAKTVERYSYIRTMINVEESDIALIVIDASEGAVELDQKIAGFVYSARKPSIIVMNKWDLVDKTELSMENYEKTIYRKLWFMRYAPIITISAMSKQRMTKVFPIIDKVIAESAKRITTNKLNLFLKEILALKEPALYRKRRVKIYYITQVKTNPPGFTVFTNHKEGITDQYLRFMERKLRDKFGFVGTPIDIYVRQRSKK
ncbi:MAG: ribosome biogenesis GTPase Der [Nitrospira sp.]|nr:ribosome biogenesis GTPase Der [Nitrospira sp.]